MESCRDQTGPKSKVQGHKKWHMRHATWTKNTCPKYDILGCVVRYFYAQPGQKVSSIEQISPHPKLTPQLLIIASTRAASWTLSSSKDSWKHFYHRKSVSEIFGQPIDGGRGCETQSERHSQPFHCRRGLSVKLPAHPSHGKYLDSQFFIWLRSF